MDNKHSWGFHFDWLICSLTLDSTFLNLASLNPCYSTAFFLFSISFLGLTYTFGGDFLSDYSIFKTAYLSFLN